VDEINNETDWLQIRLQQIPMLPSNMLQALQKLLELFLLVDILIISYFIRASQSPITIQTRLQSEVYWVKMVCTIQHYQQNSSQCCKKSFLGQLLEPKNHNLKQFNDSTEVK
jgi:hypothetical protein